MGMGLLISLLTNSAVILISATTVLSTMLIFNDEDLVSLEGCIRIFVYINILNKVSLQIYRLSPKVINLLLEAIQNAIRQNYACGFLEQIIAMITFGTATVVTTFMMTGKLRRQTKESKDDDPLDFSVISLNMKEMWVNPAYVIPAISQFSTPRTQYSPTTLSAP
ncbi:uncharacterized protein BDR25DRAFT_362614 [Lindgomyces ingoldianus]|uniref:Uncharacterized protein n=1 Tax=Lindgomyces ingoldianus TaxID=673940 RepID=A0ACB6QAT9_9PLEO|nr:uncharacterized protein BDR25DRAFT_362614 [Lindgomyces ingoldianus]KAF2463615.1 hypothetical protein BDR25DRAFT_362614 [Lindgomyces ingoldianus]